MTPPLSVLRLACGCKVNLFLRVGHKRPDGYHSLKSLFLPLPEPRDVLEVTVSGLHSSRRHLRVQCAIPGIHPENNTLTKAYDLYARAVEPVPSLSVTLHKGIPQGSGLGGGSSDAACLLRFLREWTVRNEGAGLSDEELLALGAQVGADVPFFLLNRPALAQGIGEILDPVPFPFAGMCLILVCPDLHIPTAWAFALLDAARPEPASGCLTRNCWQDTTPLAQDMLYGNDFEQVIFPVFPQLERLCVELLRGGAAVARMSGTGASVFGLFPEGDAAANIAEKLRSAGFAVYAHAL